MPVFVESIELRDELRNRLEPGRRIRMEALGDQRIDSRRNRRIHRTDRRRWAQHALHQLGHRGRGVRFPVAEQEIVQDEAERIDVGALIDVHAARLFRRHVFDRADDGAARRHRHARPGRR